MIFKYGFKLTTLNEVIKIKTTIRKRVQAICPKQLTDREETLNAILNKHDEMRELCYCSLPFVRNPIN